jgi:hypothetical protein
VKTEMGPHSGNYFPDFFTLILSRDRRCFMESVFVPDFFCTFLFNCLQNIERERGHVHSNPHDVGNEKVLQFS